LKGLSFQVKNTKEKLPRVRGVKTATNPYPREMLGFEQWNYDIILLGLINRVNATCGKQSKFINCIDISPIDFIEFLCYNIFIS